MVAKTERPALRADIRRAFADAQRPAEAEIALHECSECAAVRAAFAPFTWDRIPPEIIEEHYSALPLLSPAAFAYFLPAYLLYALDHFTPDARPSESTVYSLAPNEPESDYMAEWHRERLRPLSAEQVEVLERFLDLVEADGEFGSYIDDLAPARAVFRELWATRWSA